MPSQATCRSSAQHLKLVSLGRQKTCQAQDRGREAFIENKEKSCHVAHTISDVFFKVEYYLHGCSGARAKRAREFTLRKRNTLRRSRNTWDASDVLENNLYLSFVGKLSFHGAAVD